MHPEFVSLQPGNPPLGIFADSIEILYQVRCACIHGDFVDPGSLENNDLFQASYEFLYALLSSFLGRKTSELHS
jgi:hypothetical protein